MRNVKIFLKLLSKAARNPRDIKYYIQGHLRLWLFYSPWFGFLLRQHIRSQIEFRLRVTDRECYDQGECRLCGCEVPALQMSDKACEKPCYPPMLYATGWGNLYPILEMVWEDNKEKYYKLIKSINNELERK